jgi:hypothetical protein
MVIFFLVAIPHGYSALAWYEGAIRQDKEWSHGVFMASASVAELVVMR